MKITLEEQKKELAAVLATDIATLRTLWEGRLHISLAGYTDDQLREAIARGMGTAVDIQTGNVN
jgi:hypothetical protein